MAFPPSPRTPEGCHNPRTMPATYSNIVYHLIFATKGRAPSLEDLWRERLFGYIGGTVRGLGGVPLAIGGVSDHVHLLVALRPSHCLADFVREVKKSSSIWVHREMSRPGFAWQEGYGAFTVGAADVLTAKAYIASQGEHHRQVDSREELLRLCREAGVEVDIRFFE